MDIKCIDCYAELDNIENVNFDFSENYFYLYKQGQCPECGQVYIWREFHSLNYEGSEFCKRGQDNGRIEIAVANNVQV